MQVKRSDWVFEKALEHCLIDPQLEIPLRRAITYYQIQDNSNQLFTDEFVLAAEFLIIPAYELPNNIFNYYAKGKDNNEKQTIKESILQLCQNQLDAIKLATSIAIRENSKIVLTDFPNELHKAIQKYYENFQKVYERLGRRIKTSFSDQGIADNTEIISRQSKFYLEVEKLLSPPNITVASESVAITQNQSAFISTSIGREKPEPYSYVQEDRCNVVPNIQLHASWHHRIPEFLAYFSRELIAKVYKEVPPIYYESQNAGRNNASRAGSTFTLLFTYNDKAYVLSIGDSPAVRIRQNVETGEVAIERLTWGHTPDVDLEPLHYENPSEEVVEFFSERKRVVNDGGTIVKGKFALRVKNRINSLALSRAIGDLETKGIFSGASIVETTNKCPEKYKQFFLVGSDGLFDFIKDEEIQQLCKLVKFEELAQGLCNVALKHPYNFDNITAVVVPDGHNLAVCVEDGHSNVCVAEAIHKIFPVLFPAIANSIAPDAQSENFNHSQEKKTDQLESLTPNHEPNKRMAVSTFYSSSPSKRRRVKFLDSEFNPEKLIKKIMSWSTFVKEDVEENHFVVKHPNMEVEFIIYVPTELPMSYSEYSKIKYRSFIATSESYLDDLTEEWENDKEAPTPPPTPPS